MFSGSEEVEVEEVIESRYQGHKRPLEWSNRVEGFDIVKLKDGRIIKLYSNAQQDVPKKGWIIVINKRTDSYEWTLYGFSDQAEFTLDEF